MTTRTPRPRFSLIRTAMAGALGAFACVYLVVSSDTPATAAELIMLEKAGCPWCEKWDNEIGTVYAKTAEGRRAPLRRLDMKNALPPELQFIDKGRYTPTFVLVDQGREIGRIRGYPGEDFFWGLLGDMLKQLPGVNETTQTLN